MGMTVPSDPRSSGAVDGLAMCMLRVALPPRWTFTNDESDDEEAAFRVYACERGVVPVCRSGMTIAEAAGATRGAIGLGQR
jgi:hypothetical protein